MKKLKRQRVVLILIILASLTAHLVYGIEGAKQVEALKHQNNRQQAILMDKQEELKVKDILIDGQYKQIEDLNNQLEEQPKQTYIGEYTITAYCPCAKCCGKHALNRQNDTVTGAMGVELKEGVSVASPLPFGTRILIDGKEYISQDRTSEWVAKKYDNKIIDMYFEKHKDAEAFGKQAAKVYIMED